MELNDIKIKKCGIYSFGDKENPYIVELPYTNSLDFDILYHKNINGLWNNIWKDGSLKFESKWDLTDFREATDDEVLIYVQHAYNGLLTNIESNTLYGGGFDGSYHYPDLTDIDVRRKYRWFLESSKENPDLYTNLEEIKI